jgi:hypothetical protein
MKATACLVVAAVLGATAVNAALQVPEPLEDQRAYDRAIVSWLERH